MDKLYGVLCGPTRLLFVGTGNVEERKTYVIYSARYIAMSSERARARRDLVIFKKSESCLLEQDETDLPSVLQRVYWWRAS